MKPHLLLLLYAATTTLLSPMWVSGSEFVENQCEPLRVPMCNQMKHYNYTSMPNTLGHSSQQEVSSELDMFTSLLTINCHKMLKLFLCSLYAPMCTKVQNQVIVVKPCKAMCLAVKQKCLKYVLQVQHKWPPVLNCDKLVDNNMCMNVKKSDQDKLQNEDSTVNVNGKPIDWSQILKVLPKRTTKKTPTCSQRYMYVEEYAEVSEKLACAPRCDKDVFFSSEDKHFAKLWTLICSSVCVVSTCLLLITFLMDTTRFRYPERPIIAIAFCYFIYAGTHLVSVLIGRNSISCNDPKTTQNNLKDLYILQSGVTQKTYCAATFIISYYTTMASSCWWVVLTVTWFLAASHKWSREAISSIAVYCHLFAWFAWSVPALMTAAVLAIRKVDGDLYIGICGVGNLDRLALTWFVLVPLFTFLLVGIWFILASYAAMCRIRSDLRSDGLNICKLEKLMAKIGIFSVMYVVPVAITISCNFYIAMKLPEWLKASQQTCLTFTCPLINVVANTKVYMLRVFASLFVGSITGTWIWTPKTIATWKRFLSGTPAPNTGQKATLTLESLRQHEAMAKKDQYHAVNTTDLAKL